MTAPRLSIGLPVHDGAELLPAALDSLLAQTYDDFELLISDNASTDGTAEIAADYAARDDRVQWWRISENRAPRQLQPRLRVRAASSSSGRRTTISARRRFFRDVSTPSMRVVRGWCSPIPRRC